MKYVLKLGVVALEIVSDQVNPHGLEPRFAHLFSGFVETTSIAERLDVARASGRHVRAGRWSTLSGLCPVAGFCLEPNSCSTADGGFLIALRVIPLSISCSRF